MKRSIKVLFILLVGSLLSSVYFGVTAYTVGSTSKKLHALTTRELTLDPQTKREGCRVQQSMPDHACTPGAIIGTATKDEICTPGYSKSVRDVSAVTKKQVYAEYGITHHEPGEYEVDHMISLELGGSNDISNLFPEAASPFPGFHEKDEVENFLHAQLCNSELTLPEAQGLINDHWVEVYHVVHE